MITTLTTSALALMSLVSPLVSPGDPIAFGPPQTQAGPAGNIVGETVLVDIDHDGDTDLLLPYILSSDYGVSLNQGGALTPISLRPAFFLNGVFYPTDANLDGKGDLVASLGSSLQTALGAGHGRYEAPLASPAALQTMGIEVADFDGDGIPDFMGSRAMILSFTAQVIFHRGLGDGTFEPGVFLGQTGVGIGNSVTGDLDGDGRLDVLSGLGVLSLSSKVRSLINQGGGSFDEVEFDFGAGTLALGLEDFDGDGFGDLVASTGAGLVVYQGHGDGTFETTASATLPAGRVSVADFDADGALDIAVLAADGVVSFYRQAAPLAFRAAGSLAGMGNASQLSAVDLDEDGYPDLVANSNLPDFTWARNRSQP